MVLFPAVRAVPVLCLMLWTGPGAAQDCSLTDNDILWQRTKSCQDEIRVSCGAVPSVLEEVGDTACCAGASLVWRCGSELELEFECADESSELMLAERLETGVRFRCLAPKASTAPEPEETTAPTEEETAEEETAEEETSDEVTEEEPADPS